MAKQNSVNLDITNNADGFSIAGGSTSRTLGVSGGDITLVGSGSATLTFPTTSTTVAGLGITQTFTALQQFSAGMSVSGGEGGTGHTRLYSTIYDNFLEGYGNNFRIRHATGKYITIGDSSAFGGIGNGTHIFVSDNDASIILYGQLIWTRGPSLFEYGATFDQGVNLKGQGLRISGSTGANGQVLTSTGSSITWATPNAATSTITNTNSGSTFYPTFVGGSGNTGLFIDGITTPFTYVPSTGTINAKVLQAKDGSYTAQLNGSDGTITITDGANVSVITPISLEYYSGSVYPYYFYTATQRTFLVTQALQISNGDYDQFYGPSSWGYTFPASNGTSGQAMLTNGDGQLYWGNVVNTVNGVTGAITNVAKTDATQTFTLLQNFSAGISAAGATFSGAVISDGGYRITSNAINALTGTTYSLLTTDNGKIITWSNASGVTLTVPSGLPVGFNTTVIQIGAGAVGITGSGTTINSFEGKRRTAGQHAAVSIISYSSNVFNIAGGLTA